MLDPTRLAPTGAFLDIGSSVAETANYFRKEDRLATLLCQGFVHFCQAYKLVRVSEVAAKMYVVFSGNMRILKANTGFGKTADRNSFNGHWHLIRM